MADLDLNAIAARAERPGYFGTVEAQADFHAMNGRIRDLEHVLRYVSDGFSASERMRKAAEVDRDRLRAALLRIQEWDCLNPPQADLCADLPWLRRLVDAALGGDVA